MIAPLALALVAGNVATVLRPILDRPYRLTIDEERGARGRSHRFTLERRVVFRRDGEGLVAEVTLMSVTDDLGGEAGRRFLASAGALRGREIRFRLAADGALVGIGDEAALWRAMTAAMAAAGGAAGGRVADAPEAAMAAMPPEARRATIASVLLPVLAGADAAGVAGAHPVSVPSRLIATGEPLTGVERSTIEPDATLHLALHASAAVAGTAVSLDRERVIDRASGLVLQQVETQTVRVGDAVQVTRKTTRLTPPVR